MARVVTETITTPRVERETDSLAPMRCTLHVSSKVPVHQPGGALSVRGDNAILKSDFSFCCKSSRGHICLPLLPSRASAVRVESSALTLATCSDALQGASPPADLVVWLEITGFNHSSRGFISDGNLGMMPFLGMGEEGILAASH